MLVTISTILSLLALVSGICCMFFPTGSFLYLMLYILFACVSWALILIFPSKSSADSSTDKKLQPFFAILWLTGAAPILVMLSQNIDSFPLEISFPWKLLGLCILGGGIITGLYYWRYPHDRQNLRQLGSVMLAATLLIGGCLIQINQLPAQPTQETSCKVLSKDSRKSYKRHRYSCDISYEEVEDLGGEVLDMDGNAHQSASLTICMDTIRVSRSIYLKVQKGDTIIIRNYEGKLGIPYTRITLPDT